MESKDTATEHCVTVYLDINLHLQQVFTVLNLLNLANWLFSLTCQHWGELHTQVKLKKIYTITLVYKFDYFIIC